MESLLINFTPTQVFFCETCKIFKSIFFYRTTPVAAEYVNKDIHQK